MKSSFLVLCAVALAHQHVSEGSLVKRDSLPKPFFYTKNVVYDSFAPAADSFVAMSAEEAVQFGSKSLSDTLGLNGNELQVTGWNQGSDGTVHIYASRLINGVLVDNQNAAIHVFNGQVVAQSYSFTKASSELIGETVGEATVKVSLEDAVQLAEKTYGLPRDEHPAKLTYVQTAEDKISYAHVFQLRAEDSSEWVRVSVDAATGEIVHFIDYFKHASYKVIGLPKKNPLDGFAVVIDPENPVASPKGWTKAGSTVGNNVDSHIGNFRVNADSNLFDTNWDASQEPTTAANKQTAVVNNFYLSNVVHDITYQYGFDEASGNFQDDNYGKGGVGGDSVNINNQAKGLNNADFATPDDGQRPVMNMYLFDQTQPKRDGSLDNVIPIHEYGHGVSTRLTGGPFNSNCLNDGEAGGMGEGWSDALAMFLTWKESDNSATDFSMGPYVMGSTEGIRQYPYSTNMKTNPMTYNSLAKLNEVHDVGTVWATMLNEMYWSLVNRYGFSANLYDAKQLKGNIMALQVMIDGMKRQPCNPTFVTARNAILDSTLAYYGAEARCLVWKAFAKRGLGASAKVAGGYTNKFDLPAECNGGASTTIGSSSTTSKQTTTTTSSPTASTSTVEKTKTLTTTTRPMTSTTTTRGSSTTGPIPTSGPALALGTFGRDECNSAECALGDLIADCYVSETKADMSLFSISGVKSGINSGEIVNAAVAKRVLSFNNDFVVTIQWTGAQIKGNFEFLAAGGDGSPKFTFPQIGGVRVVINKDSPVGSKVVSLTINGAPVDPAKTYTLAGIDYDLDKGFVWDKSQGIPTYGPPNVLYSTVFASCMAKVATITPKVDGRISYGEDIVSTTTVSTTATEVTSSTTTSTAAVSTQTTSSTTIAPATTTVRTTSTTSTTSSTSISSVTTTTTTPAPATTTTKPTTTTSSTSISPVTATTTTTTTVPITTSSASTTIKPTTTSTTTTTTTTAAPASTAVPEWHDCRPKIDTCALEQDTCCVGPGDVGMQKFTCRPFAMCAPRKVENWEDCNPIVDNCLGSSFTCCIGPNDLSTRKYTCRASGYCAQSTTRTTTTFTTTTTTTTTTSAPPPPPTAVPEYQTCRPGVDTCAQPWDICCIGPNDLSVFKYTCRPYGECAPRKINDWTDCNPIVDTCLKAGSKCCVGPVDKDSKKFTCRPLGYC